MRPTITLSILALVGLLAACASSTEGDMQKTVGPGDNLPLQKLFTPSDYIYEAVPARPNRVGFDNYTSRGGNTHGSNEFHYTGKDCLRCHTAGGKAALAPFTMAGTVYKDILGSEPLAGAEVVLVNSEGKVVSMTTNTAGNFMTQAEIKDSKGNATYKTWVLGPDGKRLPMVTMTSGSCNMHHTPLGRRGALWAGLWSAAPDAAAAQTVSYTRHVAPIFAAKCVPCHVPAPDAERLLKEPLKGSTTTYDYTGGFDLVQYDSIINDEAMAAMPVSRVAPSGRSFINFEHPADSLLLAKMLAPETAHGGGKIAVNTNDPDYKTILRWIEAGAPGPMH